MVVRNSETDLYSRIWCVGELIFARKFGFTATHQTLVIGRDNFSSLRTSCLHAQSFNSHDRDRILQILLVDLGTMDEIDQLVLLYRTHAAIHPAPTSTCASQRATILSLIVCTIAVLAITIAVLAFTNISRP